MFKFRKDCSHDRKNKKRITLHTFGIKERQNDKIDSILWGKQMSEKRRDGGFSEEERRQIQARRERLRRQRIRRARRIRAMLVMAVILFCLAIGSVVMAVAGHFGKKASSDQVVSSGEVNASESDADSVSLEGADGAGAGAQDGQSGAEGQSEESGDGVSAIYGVSVSNIGWSRFFADNSYCMTPSDKYVTAFRATLNGQPYGMTGTVTYRANLSGTGWLDWVEDGNESGKADGNESLEAIAMELTGQLAEQYDILYSVLQDNQWTDWMKNGEEAGAYGVGLPIQGIRISVAKKLADGNSYAGNIDPTKPMIALTYDDGPSSESTARILAKLKEYGGRATFFMVGRQVAKNMDVVKQMVAQGCEVGNHTYDHVAMTKEDQAGLTAQLEQNNHLISDACGITPVLMRPVGGAKSDAGMAAVGAISMPAILWSVDTLDWKTRDAQSTIQTILDNVKDGDIILMHDLYSATADASEVVIPELVNRGYQLVTVSELASYRGGMIPGKSYSQFRPK